MKVIIAGPRYKPDTDEEYTVEEYYSLVANIIKEQGIDITELVCGMAKGFDTIGYVWAEDNNIPIIEFFADWHTFGNPAGPIRNKKMAEYCDAALIFSNGISRGTADMIKQMKRVKKPYLVVNIPVTYENS